jgi:2-keto-myo-inositol isomerase
MISRRKAIAAMSLATVGAAMPLKACSPDHANDTTFRFCLNSSTISGQNPGVLEYIRIASEAGYDGIELWVRDIQSYLEAGNTLATLKSYIDDHGIKVENAIGFAPWLAEGDGGFRQMAAEMHILAEIGCNRIAAPAAGVNGDQALDLFDAGEKFKRLLDLGRKTGVMPQLEFWGASNVLWHMGQILMIAAVADDPDVKILPDVYHMFRGGSGFDTLKMLDGGMIDIFHMNDYPSTIAREEQTDADRIYPGDGAAPIKQILGDLKKMGGEKVLSVELFNREYWEEDPLDVAKTALQKMKKLTTEVS